MTKSEQQKIEDAIETIDNKAKSYGLDYYDTEFLIANEELMDQLSAYVLPIRFHHWTFGKEYQKQKTMKQYGMSGTIYECVINSDPSYAFLSESNNLTEMKVVIAHVLGHVDFFKNNMLYNTTNKRMVTECALNAKKIADYYFQYGEEIVERWIDACMSIARHCELARNSDNTKWLEKKEIAFPEELDMKEEFDFLFRNDKMKKITEWQEQQKRSKPIMEKDLLLFLMHNRFVDLENWQKDVMSIVRQEMRYFMPNIQTKILNEGWSCFWHQKIIEDLDLECDFLKDDDNDWYTYYSAMNSRVLHPGSRGRLNPYLVGYTILKDIYETTGGTEQDKIDALLDIRATHTDALLIKNHLNEKVIEELDLFTFELLDKEWTVTETTNWERSRDILTEQLVEAHIPTIYIIDDDYMNNRELFLVHDYKGDELEEESAIRTLAYISKLWERPVTLRTAAHLTYEVEVDKNDNKKGLRGENLIVYIRHDGKKADIILDQEILKPTSQIAADYFDAKWRMHKFEEKIKENASDENLI